MSLINQSIVRSLLLKQGAFRSAPLLPELLANLANIIMFSIFVGISVALLISVGLWSLYLVMVAYGLHQWLAALIIGTIALLLIAISIFLIKSKINAVNKILPKILNQETSPIIGVVHNIASSFIDGFLHPSKK